MKNCTHLDTVDESLLGESEPYYAKGCAECVKAGDTWVHLRLCLQCGHVGCCDSSKNKHASRHARAVEHPVMRSLEPGETWGWCFPDELMIEFGEA